MEKNHPAIAKLETPSAHQIIRRSRVLNGIDRALLSGSCWLAAPAGYGKTTALVDYLQKKRAPHAWYRIDNGDQDVASFFHYLKQSLRPATAVRDLPLFRPEYADQPLEFARRFFRAYFAKLPSNTLLVFDDLHYAETPQFRATLAILLHELPSSLRCACLSRTLPPRELSDFTLRGRMTVIDQTALEFSDNEARTLVRSRLRRVASSIDVTAMHGWATGLVLLAEQSSSGAGLDERSPLDDRDAIFDALGGQLFDTLPPVEQDMLLKLSLLPEITADLAAAIADSSSARALLERLHQRQLLVTRTASTRAVFRLHDLLRGFLTRRLATQVSGEQLALLQERAAVVLNDAGHPDDAIDLALRGEAWRLARSLIAARADAVLAQGRRETLIDWCRRFPVEEVDAWLCYWLGVAHMADDAEAETWLSRAWSSFAQQGDLRGQFLTVSRAVLAKTDSWRTHQGLSVWTQRASALLAQGIPALPPGEQLLVLVGMVRALDFSDDYRSDAPRERHLTRQLLERLIAPYEGDSKTLRLLASESLIEHAGSTGNGELFEQAVDCVIEDLRDPSVSSWALGMWLVAFGAVSGRYFSYSRRGFSYANPEDSLRAAIAIGEREHLRGVEFGALYHLQLQMKLRNDFGGFSALIDRLGQIADSRYTTQVSVLADCQAALHTMQGNLPEAYRACERFMAAIEAANEPPIERWPHFITKFQVLLADRRGTEAARFLESLLSLFDGGVHQRTRTAIAIAEAFQEKWNGNGDYLQCLRWCLKELRATTWPAVLLNLPKQLAELCADALEHDIEVDFCQSLIRKRRLLPPHSRPIHWPWDLKVFVLGEFRLERDGVAMDLGTKPPTRSLDILRALAIAKDHVCSLDTLYDWLWPDADGDQAKAACEQALHRLRKLLGDADLIVQREGKLRLMPARVWVDLDDWEISHRELLHPGAQTSGRVPELERLFSSFSGPLLSSERPSAWSLATAERVRSKFLDLATRLGELHETQSNTTAARSIYLRALDSYPTSTGLYEALIRNRLADNDVAGVLECYARYEKMLKATLNASSSSKIRALITPLLSPS